VKTGGPCRVGVTALLAIGHGSPNYTTVRSSGGAHHVPSTEPGLEKPTQPRVKGGVMEHERTQIHGAVDAATATLNGGLATIEGVHAAISRKPFGPLRLAPGVAEVSAVVRVVHDGITRLVYAGLRTAIGAGGSAAKLAASLAAPRHAEPRVGSPADMAVTALNGFAGDRLARDGNPLAIPMTLRHCGRHVALTRDALGAAFPTASPRLAIFVHGLACNESWWQLHAQRHYGNRHTTYGTRLQKDLGYTPLYVRYNTGLHVSENGRQLAHLLNGIVTAWPLPVEELILVGHSMGGLVNRSGCHYGREADLDWVRLVRHVVYLGSPHAGAPLEKAANVTAWLLGLSEITRPLAAALNARSVGIKDLRFGALLDAHWRGADPDVLLVDRTGEVPLLTGAHHYFVAATVTRDPSHPLGLAVGDLLVREPSASGRKRLQRSQFPLANTRHFGPMTHLELLNDPDVYEQMHRWFEPKVG
jgi:pimeloyl-ACP methyl ester carboxylesterase